MRNILPLLLSLALLLLLDGCGDDSLRPVVDADVPAYCLDHVHRQEDELRRLSPSGAAEFVFITDTHYAHNTLASPPILAYLLRRGFVRRVVWGGDALTAAADIPSEWADHQRVFLSAVVPHGGYYMVRGNHEHTTRDELTGLGLTYTQLQTAALLRQHSEPDVIRPDDDPEACYYYFDDPAQRLRYCVFDATDSIASPSLPWATVPHVSQRQLAWMDSHALHHVPEGYQLVVFSHIGLLPQTFAHHGPYEPLRQLLLRAGAPVLLVLSGHLHQDFQTYDHGQLHVLTGADALYQEYSRSPFLHDARRQRRQPSAPLFDLVALSADRRMVHLVRIGAGFSRSFHLEPIHLRLTERMPLPEPAALDAAQIVSWTTYDAAGYTAQDAAWDPPTTILRVAPDAHLFPLRPGSAVLMATDREGRREFFCVEVDSCAMTSSLRPQSYQPEEPARICAGL